MDGWVCLEWNAQGSKQAGRQAIVTTRIEDPGWAKNIAKIAFTWAVLVCFLDIGLFGGFLGVVVIGGVGCRVREGGGEVPALFRVREGKSGQWNCPLKYERGNLYVQTNIYVYIYIHTYI